MGDYTVGFQGSIEYVAEDSYGGGCPTDPTMIFISDYVQSVKPRGDPGNIKIRGFDSYDVKETVAGLKKFGLAIEFYVQNSTFLANCINRQSDGSLYPLYIDLGINTDGTTKSYYGCSGCVCDSVELRLTNEDAIIATANMNVQDVTTSTSACDVGSGAHGSALGTDVYTFSGASIERPSGTALAYIVDTFTATINQNVDPRCSIGSSTIKLAPPGQRNATGNADISVADGGKVTWDSILASTENSIVWEFGSTGAPQLTFTNATFDNIELDANISDAIMIPGVPWESEGVTLGTVS